MQVDIFFAVFALAMWINQAQGPIIGASHAALIGPAMIILHLFMMFILPNWWGP